MDIGPWIGLVSSVAFFGTIIAIVAIINFSKARNTSELQKTLRMSIEKGQPLPPEFVESMTKSVPRAKNPMNDVRWGLIWMALAGGLMLWTYLDHGEIGHHMGGIAAVPGMIGLALFVLGIIGLNTRDKS